MRNKVIWSFLSLVALAAGGLAAGCDSDAKITKSSEGDSCTKTSDCNDGLRCEQGTCFKATSHIDNSGAGEGNTGGTAPVVVGPKPPVLGGPGESCTKRADCDDGLACLSQRCTMGATPGAGGDGNVSGPMLGSKGETCTLTTDCAPGLACMPGVGVAQFVGICTLIDSGLTPSPTVCGAECATAADCCELPVGLHATLGAYSCSDLADLLTGVTCATATLAPDGPRCLAYSAYCDDQCGAKTWACTDGACEYASKCTKATQVAGGCPSLTRGGRAISACDTKSGRCAPQAPVGCTTDASCFAPTPQLIVGGLGDTCSDGECACFKGTGGCYRKCSEALDCPVGYSCDDATSLCTPLDACTTDSQCITLAHDSRVKCVNGACSLPPCIHDIDCNPGGLTNGFFTLVCGPDKTCVPLGCTTDEECGVYMGSEIAGGVRSFCGPPAKGVIAGGPVSAITD
jgi:hypothetical protein